MNKFGDRPNVRQSLQFLWAEMDTSRRHQFATLMVLMFLGMIAELVTIGAVLPFLIVVSDAERAARLQAIDWLPSPIGAATPFELTLIAAGFLISAAILAGIARVTVTWATLRFVLLLSHDVGTSIFARMLRQPYSHYVTRNTSEHIAGMEKVQSVVWGVLMPGMQGIIAAITSLAIMVLLILIDPATAIVAAAVMVGAYVSVSFVARRRLAENSQRLARVATMRVQTIQEGLGGIRDILLDQSQEVFEEKFRRLDYSYRLAQASNNLIALAPRYVIESTGIVLIAVLAVYMSPKPGGIVAALPILGALALGAQRLLPMLQQSYLAWSSVAGSRDLVFDVIELMQAPIATTVPRDRLGKKQEFREAVVLEAVGFRYRSGEFALKDVNLVIPKGASIGFVGPTGSGKSTLLDLVMGLLEPTEGRIIVDGKELTDVTRSDWQAQIAHVPQAIFLADSSIAANIAFGEPEDAIDMKRLVRAARMAQIEDWVASLKEGFWTRVGERGLSLSGGQRQRIGIARAIYKRSPVLIFDEATSALDTATERRAIQAIVQSAERLTLLMIAHRTSTLTGCDIVIRLSEGRIVEHGSYAAVVGTAS